MRDHLATLEAANRVRACVDPDPEYDEWRRLARKSSDQELRDALFGRAGNFADVAIRAVRDELLERGAI